MKPKLEAKINSFLEKWDSRQMVQFLEDITPLFELFDVEEGDDWVEKAVGREDMHAVRLIRTVYLVSRIAENHAGALCMLKSMYPQLWREMHDQQ